MAQLNHLLGKLAKEVGVLTQRCDDQDKEIHELREALGRKDGAGVAARIGKGITSLLPF